MEGDEEPSYWYVSSYQIPWDRVDSLQTLVDPYTNQVVERSMEAGRGAFLPTLPRRGRLPRRVSTAAA